MKQPTKGLRMANYEALAVSLVAGSIAVGIMVWIAVGLTADRIAKRILIEGAPVAARVYALYPELILAWGAVSDAERSGRCAAAERARLGLVEAEWMGLEDEMDKHFRRLVALAGWRPGLLIALRPETANSPEHKNPAQNWRDIDWP